MSDEQRLLESSHISRETLAGILSQSPAHQELIRPVENPASRLNDAKVRRIYTIATIQQWAGPQKINYDIPVTMDPEVKAAWTSIYSVFYTLEKMGLDVIQLMMPKAVSKFKSNENAMYLAAQCFDESRHVFVIENYLRRLGREPKFNSTYQILGRIASLGIYRVENWLFSTLFSENFASAFLRVAKDSSTADATGNQLCRYLLMDESRHLQFLNAVLPDILDRMSLFGRSYLRLSQSFMMSISAHFTKSLDADAATLGIDRRALIEEVFENMERAYESYGVSRSFLRFPKIGSLATH